MEEKLGRRFCLEWSFDPLIKKWHLYSILCNTYLKSNSLNRAQPYRVQRPFLLPSTSALQNTSEQILIKCRGRERGPLLLSLCCLKWWPLLFPSSPSKLPANMKRWIGLSEQESTDEPELSGSFYCLLLFLLWCCVVSPFPPSYFGLTTHTHPIQQLALHHYIRTASYTNEREKESLSSPEDTQTSRKVLIEEGEEDQNNSSSAFRPQINADNIYKPADSHYFSFRDRIMLLYLLYGCPGRKEGDEVASFLSQFPLDPFWSRLPSLSFSFLSLCAISLGENECEKARERREEPQTLLQTEVQTDRRTESSSKAPNFSGEAFPSLFCFWKRTRDNNSRVHNLKTTLYTFCFLSDTTV